MKFVNSIVASARVEKALNDLKSEDLKPSLLSEPDMFIGGIPVPMDFAVTVGGEIDGLAFGPLAGTLLLSQTEGNSGPAMQLLIAIDDDPDSFGWSFWNTHDLSGPSLSPGISVMAKDKRLQVLITPAPPFRTMGWFTLDPEDPEVQAQVHVDTGEINLRIQDHKIYGTIEAQGQVLGRDRPVSTFYAYVQGRCPGFELLEMVTDIVGPRKFSGQWQALCPQQMAHLNLTQDGNSVQGSFTREGTINNGTVSNQILNFDWSSFENENGQGFIRAVGRGLLVGMKWTHGELDIAEPIVMEQKQIEGDAKFSTGGYPDPTIDGEALALRFLGHDLAQAGKHQEAAEVLTKVMRYYSDHANSAAVEPKERYDYLLSQGMPILTLIDSTFKAGEFPLLLKALDMAIELHRGLSRCNIGLLLFQTEAEQYIERLSGSAETIGNAAEAFDRALVELTGAGIGVVLRNLPNEDGVKIRGVSPYMPAGRVGVNEGDLLIAIDGVAIAGMDIKEVLSRLGGQVGSIVSLILLRDGCQQKVELVREPLTQMDHKRRKNLLEVITMLRNQAATLHRKLTVEVEAVRCLSEEAKKPNTTVNAGSALEELMTRITNCHREVQKFRVQIMASAKEAMSETPMELSLFQRFVTLQQKQAQQPNLDSEFIASMMALDLEFEEIERRRDSGDFDASILVLSVYTVSSVFGLEMNLLDRYHLAAQAHENVLNAPLPKETQQKLAFFIHWLDRWWSQLVTDPGKIDALKNMQKVYDRYVQLLVEFNLPEKALEASEEARARAFRDLLASRHSTHSLSVLENKAALLSMEIANAPSIKEILSLVHETDTTVLEYYVLDDTLLVWVLAPTKPDNDSETVVVHLHEIKICRAELQALVEKFTWLVSAPTGAEMAGEWSKWLGKAPHGSEALTERVNQLLMRSSRAELVSAIPETATVPQNLYTLHELATAKVLRTLYTKLIAPLEPWLPEQPDRPVIVVPHGVLFRVPFAALSRYVAAANGSDRYLIEDHALAYVPSLGIMQMVRQFDRSACLDSPSLLAVVNPAFGTDFLDSAGHPFRPLPQLEADIEHVINFYEQVKLLHGMKASTDVVLAEAPNYDVVMFATHAEALEENPMNSYLALAGGPLRLKDIAYDRRHLNSQLVILGACETGLGPVTGDGVEGFARWLMASGANALITSLWEIPEQATLEQLYSFHRAWLNDGKNMTTALREAQLKMIAEYPGQIPLWAGFILIGGWP
jgi:CHAT domain-containing protein